MKHLERFGLVFMIWLFSVPVAAENTEWYEEEIFKPQLRIPIPLVNPSLPPAGKPSQEVLNIRGWSCAQQLRGFYFLCGNGQERVQFTGEITIQ